MRRAVAEALSQVLGQPVTVGRPRAIGGGCTHHAAAIQTSAGEFFLKWRDATSPADTFEREAEGLRALAASGSGLAVPTPICARPRFLVTTFMCAGPRRVDFDEALGVGLATLHRGTATRFGFAHDTYCGATRQLNAWCATWPVFYRTQRLAPQLRWAAAGPGVPARWGRTFDRLLARLDELLDASEPPSLIHGDLWSGNVHATPAGRPALVDPAVSYSHREAELGMMTLFGGFSSRVFEAYEATWALPSGWRERLPLYALYHLINHYNLFGGGYGAQAFEVARRYV